LSRYFHDDPDAIKVVWDWLACITNIAKQNTINFLLGWLIKKLFGSLNTIVHKVFMGAGGVLTMGKF
jgi:hypothetical protein